jgi:hypothetical protein
MHSLIITGVVNLGWVFDDFLVMFYFFIYLFILHAGVALMTLHLLAGTLSLEPHSSLFML